MLSVISAHIFVAHLLQIRTMKTWKFILGWGERKNKRINCLCVKTINMQLCPWYGCYMQQFLLPLCNQQMMFTGKDTLKSTMDWGHRPLRCHSYQRSYYRQLKATEKERLIFLWLTVMLLRPGWMAKCPRAYRMQ